MNRPDRRFVLAALQGLLLKGRATDHLIGKYDINWGDQRAIARVVIQTLMQGQECNSAASIGRVKVLAARYKFDQLELDQMALAVIRGAVADTTNRAAAGDTAIYVLRHYIIGRGLPISDGPFFGLDGPCTFAARGGRYVELDRAVLNDLIVNDDGETRDFLEESGRSLAPELKQLFEDAGMGNHIGDVH